MPYRRHARMRANCDFGILGVACSVGPIAAASRSYEDEVLSTKPTALAVCAPARRSAPKRPEWVQEAAVEGQTAPRPPGAHLYSARDRRRDRAIAGVIDQTSAAPQ
jgi:hypothetical protein